MAWYEEAIFYHIYPLGMTGAPKLNEYKEPVERLNQLLPWIEHIKEIGCNAIYIGPLFESVGHGYETTDYKKLDSRLGTNETLKHFVASCHKAGLKVIFDGVFNHTGRDFFAFKDLQKNRENSRYKDWYCNVNFWGNTEYNDGFSYDNWGGYNLLVKLNQRNPEVKDYICDVIRFWVEEFDVDGIRLDAADVLDFDFMKALRQVANTVKPEFWLMGEVIHGEYSRWANVDTLHSVTNYHLHKALFSGYNDHNFFEIAHTVKRLYDMGCGRPGGMKLYNFADNHDVERIMSKLNNKAGYLPVHVLLYTLPGIPSIYYGSEFGIEGKKAHGADADAPLRPCLEYEMWCGNEDLTAVSSLEGLENSHNADDLEVISRKCLSIIALLGKARQASKALSYGDYKELMLTTRQYAFERSCDGERVLVTVNNDDSGFVFNIGASGVYRGALSGRVVEAKGNLSVNMEANSGEVWLPIDGEVEEIENSIEIGQKGVSVHTEKRASERMGTPETVVTQGSDTQELRKQEEHVAEINRDVAKEESIGSISCVIPSNKPRILECCVDSVESAIHAANGGADRLELCSNLIIGGTTPDAALVKEVKKYVNLPIHALIRPRFGDFCYNRNEMEIMKEQIRSLKAAGVQGIVIGVLNEDGYMHLDKTRELIREAQGLKITLHRAFDMCCKPYQTLEEAIQLGISTILTSGQKASAWEGREFLAELVKTADGRIDIMPGAGIHAETIGKLMPLTGATSYHMSGKVSLESPMRYRNPDVSMGLPSLSEYEIWQTSEEAVREAVEVLHSK